MYPVRDAIGLLMHTNFHIVSQMYAITVKFNFNLVNVHMVAELIIS